MCVDRPLWRIFLHIALLAFVAQRAGAVAMLYLGGASPWLIAATVFQCLTGLVAAIAIWAGRFVTASLHALGAAPSAIAQALLGVLATLALRYFIQRAQNEPD